MPRKVLWMVFLLYLPALSNADTLYSITDLGVLAGGYSTSASAISSNGLVAGSGDSAASISQPFRWSSATGLTAIGDSVFGFGSGINSSGMLIGYQFSSDFSGYRAFYNAGSGDVLVPTLGGANNAATGINNAGTIVGYSDTSSGAVQGFNYALGILTPLGVLPGGTASRANAISNSGVIVGQVDTPDGSLRAAVSSGGIWSPLDLPAGYESSSASAVSDAGHIAGTLNDGFGGTMAFLWAPSIPLTLLGGLAPGGNSRAYGVNSGGFVVGTADGTAFLYDGLGIYDLNSLLSPSSSGWLLSEAAAIDDRGQIAGTGYYNGEQHAFLLSPEDSVPEPPTLALACGAMLVLAVTRVLHFRKEKEWN